MTTPPRDETDAVRERYAQRAALDALYHPLQPDVWRRRQERERALIALLQRLGWHDTASLRLTEVGCGTGDNLLEMLRLGLRPEHLTGLELLPQRFEQARRRLAPAVRLELGDATRADVEPASQHIVLQSTVFSSLLDEDFQQRLADAMWRWVAPGGGVLWYDFTFDNPRNTHVRGVPLSRVQRLFPEGRLSARRVTLAPPIARRALRVSPLLHDVLAAVPWLRTHVLAWIGKPRGPG